MKCLHNINALLHLSAGEEDSIMRSIQPDLTGFKPQTSGLWPKYFMPLKHLEPPVHVIVKNSGACIYNISWPSNILCYYNMQVHTIRQPISKHYENSVLINSETLLCILYLQYHKITFIRIAYPFGIYMSPICSITSFITPIYIIYNAILRTSDQMHNIP